MENEESTALAEQVAPEVTDEVSEAATETVQEASTEAVKEGPTEAATEEPTEETTEGVKEEVEVTPNGAGSEQKDESSKDEQTKSDEELDAMTHNEYYNKLVEQGFKKVLSFVGSWSLL